jgi:hypothetical protein
VAPTAKGVCKAVDGPCRREAVMVQRVMQRCCGGHCVQQSDAEGTTDLLRRVHEGAGHARVFGVHSEEGGR